MLSPSRIASIKPPATGQEEHRDHHVTGLRLRVGTTGKKTWILRVRVGPKVINRKLGNFPTMGLQAARIAAEKVLEAIARDGSTSSIDLTFGAVAAAWIEKRRADKRYNKSIELERRRLELHVLPKWGDRKLIDMRRSDVRQLVDGIEGDVLPNRILTIVRTIYRFALSRDWLEASPADGITKPREEFPRDRFLDMQEISRVWDAAGLVGYPFGHLVRTLILTGQRRSEVATLRWSSLDLEAATWILKADETKAKRAHLVPLSPAMLELLTGLPRIGGDYVFTSDGATHFSGFTKLKTRLDRFLEAAGGAPTHWTLHDLRRTVSSHMARLGYSREIRGRVLNHAVQGVTDRHYTPYDFHVEKRAALESWAAEVGRVLGRRHG